LKNIKLIFFEVTIILVISLIFLGNYFNAQISNVITIGIILFCLSAIIFSLIFIKQNKKSITRIIQSGNEMFEENEVIFCEICLSENSKSNKYCHKCGNDLRDITCPICQTNNLYNQKYCIKCNSILQNRSRHL